MQNKEQIESSYLRAYYDESQHGYMIYLPDGTPLPGVLKVTISDNYGEGKGCTVTFQSKIDIVNINTAKDLML